MKAIGSQLNDDIVGMSCSHTKSIGIFNCCMAVTSMALSPPLSMLKFGDNKPCQVIAIHIEEGHSPAKGNVFCLVLIQEV